MQKIYPKKNIISQLVIKMKNKELIFTNKQDILTIDYIFFNHKIPKTEIKATNLILKSGNINRIFIICESNIKIEFHIGDKTISDRKIFDFFENLLNKDSIIVY